MLHIPVSYTHLDVYKRQTLILNLEISLHLKILRTFLLFSFVGIERMLLSVFKHFLPSIVECL